VGAEDPGEEAYDARIFKEAGASVVSPGEWFIEEASGLTS